MKATTWFASMLRGAACCLSLAASGQTPITPPPHPYGLPVPPQPAPKIEWTLVGSGRDIAVGALGTYIIGTDNLVYSWNGSSWDRQAGLSGTRIAVDDAGLPWLIDPTKAIPHGVGMVYQVGPGTDIGIGAGSVWIVGNDAVGNDHSIYRLSRYDNRWEKMPGAAVRIDVDGRGNAWVVNSSHQIFQWVGSSWKQVPGAAIDIGISKKEGSVWIVDPAGRILKRSNDGWAVVPGGLTNISVDDQGIPWGTNAGNQVWAGYIRPTVTASTTFKSAGPATTIQAAWPVSSQGMYASNTNYPQDRPCPTGTYTVPFGVYFVRVTATGGSGADAHASGGLGAIISAVFPVTPRQTLYAVGALDGLNAGRSNLPYHPAYPGGGWANVGGGGVGGGFSMVSTSPPARSPGDPDTCNASTDSIMVVAGGGGGAGTDGQTSGGGIGGDAGMANQNGTPGAAAGGGHYAGGGGSGGTLAAGGSEGSHNGCGSDARYPGSFLRGGDTSSDGGAGGGGYYGGGAGGDGDCFLSTGSGGGGGGSSFVARGGMSITSAPDTKKYPGPGVVIEPVRPN